MEVENTLAKIIDAAGSRAGYDECCKNLLASRQILARILKNCVPEFRDCSVKDIEEKYIEGTPQVAEVPVHQDEVIEKIKGEQTEDVSINEGKVTYDIRFDVLTPEGEGQMRMQINLESQRKYYVGYPLVKRGVYYGSRMISRQRGTVFFNEQYEKIQKVYSIWICLTPPAYRKNTICQYSMTESIVNGNVPEPEKNYDLLTVIMIYLGGNSGGNYEGILKMLDVLLSAEMQPGEKKEILKNEFDIAMTQKMEKEAVKMCNLSQGIVDETLVVAIMNLMDTMNWPEEKSMKALKIPEDQWEEYHMMIEDKMTVSQV